jgi:flagellar FliL protein
LADDEAQVEMADKKSLFMWIGATLGLSAIGAGVGGFLGITIIDHVKAFEKELADRAPPLVTPKYGPNISLMDLPPIISNLSEPANSWVRLQAAIIYDNKLEPKPQMLAATISADVLAYLKTVTVAQIAGASGLEHLREDLNERVAIRSDGHVHELIIETLVVQ